MQTPSPILADWLQRLQQYAQTQARAWGQPAYWMHPAAIARLPQGQAATWNQDLRDNLDGAKKMFSRDWQKEVVQEAHSKTTQDPSQAPPVAHLILSQLEGDILAAAQRAYFARHSSFVRDQLHAAQRLHGLGDPEGVIAGGWINHLSELQKRGSAAQGG